MLESYFSEYGKLFDIKFDFAVIGPEAFIADGFTEFLEEIGIPVIAPNKKYGLIETSKIFAHEILWVILEKRNINLNISFLLVV